MLGLLFFLQSVKGNFMPHLNFLVDVLKDIMTPPNLTAEVCRNVTIVYCVTEDQ